MKILVTGAAGFLGRAVVESLCAHGERDVRCFVRPNSSLSALEETADRYPDARIEFVVGNLASYGDACRAVEGVDTIYHVAAGMRGLPATIFTNSVVASKCLLNAMQDKKRRVVLVSSIGVYGTSFLSTRVLIDENTNVDQHPEKRNIYFHAKIWQERLFWERAERGEIDLTVVRPGVLYGAGNPNRGFPSRIGISIGRTLLVFGGGHRLPLSHVLNCAEAVVAAGRSAEASGQTYNAIDDQLPTSNQYLRQHKREVRKVRTVYVPYLAAMLLSRVVEKLHKRTRGQIPAMMTPYETSAMWKGHRFDNQKLKKLGWEPVVSTEDGLLETFAYLRAGMKKSAAADRARSDRTNRFSEMESGTRGFRLMAQDPKAATEQ